MPTEEIVFATTQSPTEQIGAWLLDHAAAYEKAFKLNNIKDATGAS